MTTTLCRDCTELITPAAGRCPQCHGTRLVAHEEIEALSIAHIDCDAFYASVEKRDRPELKDQPLIVGHGARGVVTTACYLARRFGVRSAMPMFMARELCPQAVVLPPEMAKYKEVSRQVRAVFEAATDVIEPVSLDEAYLDLSATRSATGRAPAQALAEIAGRIEDEIAITVSIGLSYNKFLAKLASELQKPRGFSMIGAGEARRVLQALPVSKINGVGAVMARRLEAAGYATIGDLQRASERELAQRFGKMGARLAEFARGEDSRRVTPDRETKSISAETTFRRDTADVDELCRIVTELAGKVASQLARKGFAGRGVVVKLKTSDFRIVTRSRRLARATQKESVLAEAATALVAREADGRLFRLVGVGVDDLLPASEADPPDLFEM